MPTKTKPNKPYPTFGQRKSYVEAGRVWLAAKEAKDAAEAALKEAREALVKALPIEQQDDEVAILATPYLADHFDSVKAAVLTVGDRKILVQRIQRRDFDVEALDEGVSDYVFAQVTLTTVNTEAFDAAVTMGLIDDEVVDDVVTTRDVLSLREVQ